MRSLTINMNDVYFFELKDLFEDLVFSNDPRVNSNTAEKFLRQLEEAEDD